MSISNTVFIASACIFLSACNSSVLLLKADFEEPTAIENSVINLPGDPQGDRIELNQSESQVVQLTAFDSRALDLQNKPREENNQTFATYPQQHVDFILSGENHSNGTYVVSYDLGMEAMGTSIGDYSITVLSSSDEVLYSLIVGSSGDTALNTQFFLSSAQRSSTGTLQEKLAVQPLISGANEHMKITSVIDFSNDTFTWSISGAYPDSFRVSNRLLMASGSDIKKIRVNFYTKDTRSVRIGIDNMQVVSLDE